MPFALVLIGLIMIVTGARDTYAQFGAQVRSDFTGDGNFLYWIAAIGAIGSLGYINKFRGFSQIFMALIIIAMILANGGFFDKLTQALATGPISPDNSKPTATPIPTFDGRTGKSLTPTPTFSQKIGQYNDKIQGFFNFLNSIDPTYHPAK